jgi:hypothetical protein
VGFTDKHQIKSFLESFENKRGRTLVIIDYGNVVKWELSLGWKIGIKQLSILIKNFSLGRNYLINPPCFFKAYD